MYRKTKHLIIAAAITFSIMGVSQAKENDNGKGCSVESLRGVYLFHASGFSIVGGVSQPKAIVELFRLDGDGKLTAGVATVSINGNIIHSPGTAPGAGGTYAVHSSCVGSLTFSTGPAFDFFVAKRSKLQMIQTNPNNVFQGTAERLSD